MQIYRFMNKYIPDSILRQVFFIAIFIVVLLLVFFNLSEFLPALLGAFCLYVLLLRPLKWMMAHWKMKKIPAVLLLILSTLIVVVTPLVIVVRMLIGKVGILIGNKEQIQRALEIGISIIQEETGIDVLKEINVEKISGFAIKFIQGILNTSLNGIMQLMFGVLLLYFMLMNYRQIQYWVYNNIPLKKKNLKLLGKDLRDLVISNAVGMPLVAFIQAIVAYIGYLIFGVEGAFTWFVFTIFGAMLPLVGASIVWVPAVVYLIATGDSSKGFMLFGYCIILVGLTDNVARFLIQKVMADVHPLITIFGVILGIKLFGFIGLIFGPIFLSLVFWLYRIYQLEFGDEDNPDDELHEKELIEEV